MIIGVHQKCFDINLCDIQSFLGVILRSIRDNLIWVVQNFSGEASTEIFLIPPP